MALKNFYLPVLRRLLGGLALTWLPLATAWAQQPATILQDAEVPASPRRAALAHARPLALDLAAARALLAAAPAEGQASGAPLVLTLPLPDGGSARFALRQTALMAPALAAQFPDIKTYAGYGLDDAHATLRLDLTPAGLHAQILSPATGTIYIDPARRGDTRHYLSFFKRDMRRPAAEGQACTVDAAQLAKAAPLSTTQAKGAPATIASGSVLRTYRLAVAATAEYTNMCGGTVALAQAAIVTSVNRLSGVFEKEVAVRFQLVPNNALLIYLNPSTDPYTNGDSQLLLDENQATIDQLIGPANYDLGHVFGYGGGGRAYLSSVCQPGIKAQGNTGAYSLGDAFDIDVAAHEFGHHFGAGHSFNALGGFCAANRRPLSAWEPGGGSTIMSYSGSCSPDDIAFQSDDVYHAGSYAQMRTFILSTSCATVAATANTPPLVSSPAGGLTLPVNTPFKLTAAAVDVENDPLTYSWEELDLGAAAYLTAPQTANDNRPLFRSYAPVFSATRYFPALEDLVQNFSSPAEQLPTVTRQLTFKCTVRDQHTGPAGTIGGVTSSDSVKLRVTNAAGPFVVTSPNTLLSWIGGTAQTVTWNVAGTTANGVNCATVNVRLSTNGGYTYPTILALSVPNNGSAAITVPNTNTSQARIMVEAADNYFFDISNANFNISSVSACAPPTTLAIGTITNISAQLSFAPVGTATQYLVTTTPATTSQTVSGSPVSLTGLTPGTTYTVQVRTVCSGSNNSRSTTATTTFRTTAPPLCALPSELAVTNRTMTSASVSFASVAGATSYTISTSPATTPQTVTASPANLTGLTPGTRYIVSVTSTCASGSTSSAATTSFRTLYPTPANDLCANALPLTCGVRQTGYTENATTTGDPTTFCDVSVDNGGVFYTLRTAGGLVNLTMCDLTTDYDPKLFVYQGACGGPYTCVVGNDDTNANGCAQPSSVNFTAVAGEMYLIFVSGYDQETGSFGLLATCAPLATAPLTPMAFQVLPNPVGAGAAFQIKLAAAAAQATATLCNVLGQKLISQNFIGSNATMSTVGLAAGTYLLTVQVAGQVPAVRRVVVE